MRRFEGIVIVITAATLLAVALPASGHDSPDHGVPRTPLVKDRWGAAEASRVDEPAMQNFRFIAHLPLGGKAPDGDIWFQDQGRRGRFVYVGTWREPCTRRGVKIVRVSRPGRPRLVAVARLGFGGVSYEDPVVERIGRKWILGVGIQACTFGARTGAAFFNVTQPGHPRLIRFVDTSHGVHEMDMVRRADGRVLALLATPYSEAYSRRGDFRIVDVTRPGRAREIADWGVIGDSQLSAVRRDRAVKGAYEGLGYYAAHLAHSVRAADRGLSAYVSYWDGGLLKFDIRHPRAPRLVGRTKPGFDDDGDTHSFAPLTIGGKRYLLENDEDWDAPSPAAVTSSATGADRFHAIETYTWLPTTLWESGTITAPGHLAGDGCQASDYNGAAGEVAVVEHIPYEGCSLYRRARRAAGANVGALVISFANGRRNPDPSRWDRPNDDQVRELATVADGMPGVMVSRADGLLSALEDAGGAFTLTLTPQQPRLGGLRVYDESMKADTDGDGVKEFAQVGSFDDLPQVVGVADPKAGQWSIHNTEVSGSLAFSSWYSHGVIALDVSDPTTPEMVGRFTPPKSCLRARAVRTAASRGCFPLVWGLALDHDRGLVYMSDMRSGLWIARPTGPAAF